MKFILKLVLLLLSGFIAIGCGENKTNAGDDSSINISSIPEKKNLRDPNKRNDEFNCRNCV